MQEEEFVYKSKWDFFGDTSNVEMIYEVPGDESSEFMDKLEGYES